MPTYEYRCPDGHEFERFYRKMSDATADVSCPTCGKTAARKMSKGGGLLFKGSGFYLTDYGKNAHRKGDAASAGKGEGTASESGAAEGTSKSEPAPAAKPDAAAGSASASGGESKSSGASDTASSPKKGSDKPSSPRKSDS